MVNSQEAVRDCEGGCRGPGRHAELGEDVLQVAGDRVLADHERRRDLPVALAGGDQLEHLQLAGGEAVRLPRRGRAAERVDTRYVGCRAEPGEGVARTGEL